MSQDQLNRKLANLSFLLAALVAAFVAYVSLEILAGFFVTFAKLYDSVEVSRGVPVFVGVLTFVVLVFTPSVRQWGEAIVAETRKVVWVSRKEAVAMTMACLVMLLFSGLFLGGVDFVATEIVKWFLG